MSPNNTRQPAGIPAGGQFAATAHAEPSMTLTPPPSAARPDQDWHDAAASLEEGGRTPAEARTAMALVLSNQLATSYLENGKAALAQGYETHAAMLVIAHSSLQHLPLRIHEAGGDQAAARQAVTDARSRLRRAGSMLDMMHPSGREPVFRSADEVLARFEVFLSPGSPEGH
ncbi:hypothetical protein GCM10023063_14860 [Arthrobacter methylotrophus]|uniref:SAV-6107-like HEPN domain-containing protein n=1 Tax=Arthrobacter methylotrophus TaxID=121291 RepID=A0ABV5UR08_9MICC